MEAPSRLKMAPPNMAPKNTLKTSQKKKSSQMRRSSPDREGHLDSICTKGQAAGTQDDKGFMENADTHFY